MARRWRPEPLEPQHTLVYRRVKPPNIYIRPRRYTKNGGCNLPSAIRAPIDIRADVYFPDQRDGPRPIMLFIHGEGWVYGSRKDYSRAMFQRFLGQGFVVVSMDYRLMPESSFKMQKDDVRYIEGWLRSETLWEDEIEDQPPAGGNEGSKPPEPPINDNPDSRGEKHMPSPPRTPDRNPSPRAPSFSPQSDLYDATPPRKSVKSKATISGDEMQPHEEEFNVDIDDNMDVDDQVPDDQQPRIRGGAASDDDDYVDQMDIDEDMKLDIEENIRPATRTRARRVGTTQARTTQARATQARGTQAGSARARKNQARTKQARISRQSKPQSTKGKPQAGKTTRSKQSRKRANQQNRIELDDNDEERISAQNSNGVPENSVGGEPSLQGAEVVDEDMPDVNVEEDGTLSSEPEPKAKEPKKVKPKSLQEELIDRGDNIELDAKRIIVVGASAGAHLALLTPTLWNTLPTAIISLYGPTNFRTITWRSDLLADVGDCNVLSLAQELRWRDPPTEIPDGCLGRYDMIRHIYREELLGAFLCLGVTEATRFTDATETEYEVVVELPLKNIVSEKELDAISPVYLCTQTRYPPVYQLIGSNDHLFHVSQADEMHNALRGEGYESVRLEADGRDHGFDVYTVPGDLDDTVYIKPMVEWAYRITQS